MWRELDSRESDGLIISLDWNSISDALKVHVIDQQDDCTVTVVPIGENLRHRASDVFDHPFAFAALEEMAA